MRAEPEAATAVARFLRMAVVWATRFVPSASCSSVPARVADHALDGDQDLPLVHPGDRVPPGPEGLTRDAVLVERDVGEVATLEPPSPRLAVHRLGEARPEEIVRVRAERPAAPTRSNAAARASTRVRAGCPSA
jgi:hypothetical protein